MIATEPSPRQLSRRRLLALSAGAMTAAGVGLLAPIPRVAGVLAAPDAPAQVPSSTAAGAGGPFDELDAKIEAGMERYKIPGVAVAVIYQNQEYVRGYGVTNIDYPQAVDADTLFRIGSTTKTFTGTTLMRLAAQGRIDLHAPVRRYLPGLRLADAGVAERVTVRQLVNHSAGWLGDDYRDFGRGADAVGRYVAGMADLPQLTPLGQVFAYNNAAVVLAGHVIETVAGKPYDEVVREQLLDPLGLDHTYFFSDEIIGYNIAASHLEVDGKLAVVPQAWASITRSLQPTGALISSARDQARYLRFHLGQVGGTDGAPLLSPEALRAMRSDLGPGGTLDYELQGVGINWLVRPTAEGVPVVNHGGTVPGQLSGLLFVPDRDFAMTVLTNGEGGDQLRTDLFTDDWALARFAGVHNPPAVPRSLAASDLAAYEGDYTAEAFGPQGPPIRDTVELRATDGGLLARSPDADEAQRWQFYREDYLVLLDDGRPAAMRTNFVRGADGRVAWWSNHGRLLRRAP